MVDLLATVIAQKFTVKGMLYGMLQSGGTIPLDNIFALRITPKDDKFVMLEIITNGINNPIKFQRHVRPKKIVVKEDKKKAIIGDAVQKELLEEDMFKNDRNN